MHASAEGPRSHGQFIVLDTMSILIFLLFSTVTQQDWFQASLQWLALVTGKTVSPCHPAQIKGAKGGKLESDILNLKTIPAKSKFCRISDIAIIEDFALLCAITLGSQGWESSPLTFSKHDYTSHNFPARFLHRANRDAQIFLLHP